MIYMRAKEGGEFFKMRKDLLDRYAKSWDQDQFASKRRIEGNITYIRNTVHDRDQLLGLKYWLEQQDIPPDYVLEHFPCAGYWNYGEEGSPLACSLAIDLYPLAQDMSMTKLANDIMTFLFNEYMVQGIAPDLARVNWVFLTEDLDMPLPRFCVDAWYKLSPTLFHTQFPPVEGSVDFREAPKAFLYGVLQRHSEFTQARRRERRAPSTRSTRSNPAYVPWEMRLRDYHDHRDRNYPEHKCECFTEFDLYLIE